MSPSPPRAEPYNPRPMASVKDLRERVAILQARFEQLKESL